MPTDNGSLPGSGEEKDGNKARWSVVNVVCTT